ncbi:choline/carnitine O-acyltransferase [Rothia sp. AR01]|uniref:Choline/carnitine O-acyltransferase n=2 Tax=Rothia santali TaxID=2949643 RepID=A0A9X2KGD4_9MICC|nr:choline/carnitine O-acyltransferase [Rothia santali]
MERLLADPHNAATYRRLADLLFVAGLAEETADDAEHLRAFAFDAGRAWARKPLSYEIGLADEWACVHVEHSIIDGATLLEAVRRMQEADPEAPSERPAEPAAQPPAGPSAAAVTAADVDAGPPAPDASDGARQEDGSDPVRSEESPAPAELTWRLAPEVLTALRGPLEDYRRRAARLRVALVRVPRVPEERLPFPMSADGLQQLIMTVAQLLTYGRVRSVYESVDTRAFQAGRTECLRPVTPEAIAFARSLLAGRAERDGLAEALAAHRDWVKACKTGRGVDRHLTGLEEAARRLDIEDAFFADESLARLRADFLSTTSLGTADRIVRYAFAPSLPHGFGVSYTRYPESFEYCLAYDAEEAERPRLFRSNLAEAAGLLARFIAAVAPY